MSIRLEFFQSPSDVLSDIRREVRLGRRIRRAYLLAFLLGPLTGFLVDSSGVMFCCAVSDPPIHLTINGVNSPSTSLVLSTLASIIRFLLYALPSTGFWLFLMWLRASRLKQDFARIEAKILGHPELFGRGEIELTDSEVRYRNEAETRETHWRAIESVEVDDHRVLLSTFRGAGIRIPRSAFATPEALAAFLDFAQERLKANRLSI